MTREQGLAADQDQVSMKAFWRRGHLLKLNNNGGLLRRRPRGEEFQAEGVESIEPSGGHGLDMFEGLKDIQGREGSRCGESGSRCS